ncbi:MAG: molybdate ABC transporter substrate-binding protein [Peptostreptococcaceae bacterium]
MFKKILLLFCVTTCISACNKNEESVTVSIASSIYEPMKEISNNFEKDNNIKININSGSSGTLKKQIENGADVDIFFSANEQNIDDLINKEIIESKNVTYPIKNSLVLIKNTDKNISSINDIIGSKIIIGEITSVPVGIYSKEYLDYENVFDDLEIIYGKDASSVKNYVENGHVEFGIIYKTDSINLKNSEVVFEIDKKTYSDINYLLAKITDEGEEFFEYVNDNKEVFEKFGFEVNYDN